MRVEDVNVYKSRIKQVLITQEEIEREVKRAAGYIDSLYDGKPIMLVGILKGSFVFLADVCKRVSVPCELGFMCVKSYFDGTDPSGEVRIVMDLDRDISNYHVVICEDIIDTGRTLAKLKKMLGERKPLSLDIITLLDKPERREAEIKADLSLFTIPDKFVIGYGLDCAEYYRNLPYIAVYSEE